jgi:hypothetical protein
MPASRTVSNRKEEKGNSNERIYSRGREKDPLGKSGEKARFRIRLIALREKVVTVEEVQPYYGLEKLEHLAANSESMGDERAQPTLTSGGSVSHLGAVRSR